MRHGFLLLRKPKGPTSHDVVAIVRRALGEKDIGHLGTLDPAATGLLVLAVGAKALKVVELFNDLPKEYVAGVRFGAVSSTYDGEGVIENVPPRAGWIPPDPVELRRRIEERFLGSVQQVPPAFSAIKVAGQTAHRAARRGKPLDLPPRHVEIARCDIEAYAYPDLTLRVACSSGTYIRSLAHDLGQVLRCGAYLSSLDRTRVGQWSVDAAYAPDGVAWANVLPLKDVLAGFPRIDLSDAEAEDIRHGRVISRELKGDVIAWHEELPFAIIVPARDGSRAARPRKVF
ncbi:MAG: tRNA pseudouridine55 synthase [Candidatus Peregrinibacteria bacterium Gr01-1014_25]|nr:MAG: tRNA pseudouridine55 synthase [Candidatus Peregrinibacteria bacterium Gr01-1014_25]